MPRAMAGNTHARSACARPELRRKYKAGITTVYGILEGVFKPSVPPLPSSSKTSRVFSRLSVSSAFADISARHITARDVLKTTCIDDVDYPFF